MVQTASELLAARCRRMAAEDGLVNMKFVLEFDRDATLDGVCAEVLEMLDACDRGEAKPFKFNDGRVPRAVTQECPSRSSR